MTAFSSLYGERLSIELGSADSTQLFTDARRKAAVNRGQEEFADLTECLQRSSTITVVSGQQEYSLLSTATPDFTRLLADGVEYTYVDNTGSTQVLAGADLPRKDIQWLNEYEPDWRIGSTSTGATTPQYYYVTANGSDMRLGFYPTPIIGTSGAGEIRVTYLTRPTVVTSDTGEPFTVNSSVRSDLRPYQQATVHYAAAQLEKLRRNVEAVGMQMQAFMAYVQRYRAQNRVRQGQTIRAHKEYFTGRRGDDRPKDPRI